ncbi:MAG: DUF4957 domain-containing protein, partial [Kiritimatiellaceae bacterium]|nr:DUF4957 domain-containing protein [Kiritimatiellaceae bacterium]
NLQQSIWDAAPGDTIILPSGVYEQSVKINKSITIDGNGATLKVQSNESAIQIDTSRPVVLKNLEIQYGVATKPKEGELSYAVYTSGGDLLIENCQFKDISRPGDSPCAVSSTDSGTLHIKNSRFDGFTYTIQFWNKTKGRVEDCLIMNSGHCGITIGEASEGTLLRNIVTGSRFHGIRCTGGEIHADSNLIIANQNRGFYIGNKSAIGTLSNNLIVDNATGINVFANSRLTVVNNTILRSTYAGVAISDTAKVDLKNNVVVSNETGLVGFSAEKDNTPSISLRAANLVYGNTVQSEGIKLPSEMIGMDPQFERPEEGLFTLRNHELKGMGLSDPIALHRLWSAWRTATAR